MTASMSAICKKMKDEGFEYCSISDPHALQCMTSTPEKMTLECGGKPGQCTWFSPIQPMWDGDNEEYSKDDV
jgi:hypothetical protein